MQYVFNVRTKLCKINCFLTLVVLSIAYFSFSIVSASGQSDLSNVVGIPEHAHTLPVRFGFVNLDNGNLHLEIPLYSQAERGHEPATNKLVYDSTFWIQGNYGATLADTPLMGGGWLAGLSSGGDLLDGGLTAAAPLNTLQCQSNTAYPIGTIVLYNTFTATDDHGTTHTFVTGTVANEQCFKTLNGDQTTADPDNCAATTDDGVPESGSGYATDGSGYFATITYCNGGISSDVYAPNGDNGITPNGNEYFYGSVGALYDDIGTSQWSILSSSGTYNGPISQPYSALNPHATTFSRPVWNGAAGSAGQATYTEEWEYVPVCTGSGQSHYCGGIWVIQQLVLPDGETYQLGYDTGTSPSHFGQLTSITLPTGGTVSYGYQFSNQNSSLIAGQVSSITDNGGTTSISYSPEQTYWEIGVIPLITYYPITVTHPAHVVSPNSTGTTQDVTVYSSTQYSFTQMDYSGANTLMQTTSTALDAYLRPTNVTSTWAATGESHQVNIKYADDPSLSGYTVYPAGIDLVGQLQEYNSGSLVRTVKTSYQQDTSSIKYVSQYHMLNYPSSMTLLDANNQTFAQIQYRYDEYSASYCSTYYPSGLSGIPMLTNVSGAAGHDDAGHGAAFYARGNVTSTIYSGSNLAAITTHKCYDTLGNVTQTIDGKNYATRYSYTDSFYEQTCLNSGLPAYALPTSTTNALGQRTATSYYSCDRNPQSVQGPNDLAASRTGTTYTYDTSSRPLCTSYPDGGQSCSSYPSALEADNSTLVTSGVNQTIRSFADAFGRQITQIDQNSGTQVDTTYDPFNRVNSHSNPHSQSSSSSDGITYYSYDALGRSTGVKDSDGSVQSSIYNGNTVTFQDENGNQWQRTNDSLGRLTKVLEPNGASKTPSLETDYTSYDPLNNLLSLTQKGNSISDVPLTRQFVYDAASRLLSATNPEVGNSTTSSSVATTYSYDANGNLTQKIAPATNALSGTLRTEYCYDALSRLTYAYAYSGTITCSNPYSSNKSSFAYDGAVLTGSVASTSTTFQNAIGQITDSQAWSLQNLISERVPYQFDPMGRLLQEQQILYAPSGTQYSLSNQYNFAGNQTSAGNSATGITIGYSYDASNRLSSVTSSLTSMSTATYPATLYAVSNYGPIGVSNATYGLNSSSDAIFNLFRYYDNRQRVRDNEVYPNTFGFGSATITIAGNEWCLMSSEIPGGGCVEWEQGTVSVTAGVTETAAIGSGSNAQDIADALAAGFNQNAGSTVTATVSNSSPANLNTCVSGYVPGTSPEEPCAVLTLTAIVGGQYGNIPLSVSNTVTASNNGSLSFSFTPSGTILSGGTGTPQSGGQAYVYTLSYDHVGNVAGSTDPYNGSWSNTYDTLNRLTSGYRYNYTGQGVETPFGVFNYQCWAYDDFGNRTNELESNSACPSSLTPSTSTHWTQYAARNQITSSDTMTGGLIYDAAGNVIQDSINNYVYDSNGRVCAVQNLLTGAATQYIYDADGNRVGKGTLTIMPASGSACNAPIAANGFTLTSSDLRGTAGNLDAELTSTGWTHNVFLGNSLMATYTEVYGQQTCSGGSCTVQVTIPSLYFNFNDWLGTKRLLVNAAGQMLTHWASDPFGNYQYAWGSTSPSEHHFTGKERDTESGNDYFGARYYGSSMGRFMSPDPSGLFYADPSNPQSFNLYSYVLNNPLKNSDPDGLRCVWDDGSFDSDDDQQTGKQSDCEAAGGTYYKPGEYAAGVDWANTNQDGTLSLHGVDGSAASVSVTATATGVTADTSLWVTGYIADVGIGITNVTHYVTGAKDVSYYRFFMSHYCGPGGSGDTTGVMDKACKAHDACYAAAGLDASVNTSSSASLSLSQASAAQGCNQALYNAARSNPNATGSNTLRLWLTKGDQTPFGGQILAPGTEAKPW